MAEAHYRAASSWCCWCETGLQPAPVKAKILTQSLLRSHRGTTGDGACQGGEALPSPMKGRKGNQQALKNQAGQRRGLPPAEIRAALLGTPGQHRQLPAQRTGLQHKPPSAADAPAQGTRLEGKVSSPNSGCSTVFTRLSLPLSTGVTAHSWCREPG